MDNPKFKQILEDIYNKSLENIKMNEEELYSIFDKSGFFEFLGYEKFGVDIRKQYTIIGKRKIADYVCLDEYQNVIFVLEAKKPAEEKIEDALEQLWNRYVIPLKSKFGVLTNGKKLILYERLISNEHFIKVDDCLLNITNELCNVIYSSLKKPQYEITNFENIKSYFESVETLSLQEPLSKEFFFESFKLDQNSIFGLLVINLANAFNDTYSNSKFLKGAYTFWENAFARKPDKIPDTWKPFLRDDIDVFKFMFCLETAYALIARLIVAKACEDLDFPMVNISKYTIDRINRVRDKIAILGYPLILEKLLKEMRDQLIYSIFEEDIFCWWTDCFNKFKDKTSLELLQEDVNYNIYNFSIVIAKVIFILYKFDLSQIAGDPLGDLYQKYFDRETRRALGEFYTPIEVVEYILNAIDYRHVTNKRLIDPACGSGTFLVEALKIYLKEAEKEAKDVGWAYILRDLCNNPKIVGLDIHPFACLMSQIRFMLELIPYYKNAIEEEKLIVFESLQRLPIFRTDSLYKEMIPPEFRKTPTLLLSKEDINFNIDLPIKIDKEDVIVSINLPSWQKTVEITIHAIYNLDEYFCVVQAIFDAIKNANSENMQEIPQKMFEAHIKKYLQNRDFELITNFFIPYANIMLETIINIQKQYEDGRLLKSIEDSVLASLLKNYISYDFVVGNPPYVKTQRFSQNKKYLRKVYNETVYKNFDIYVPFIQRGIEWLNDGGKFGYIVSNMFHKRDYGEKLRKYILQNCRIDQFINFGASGVFKDVTNYPCIIILEKVKNKHNLIKCVRVAKEKKYLIDIFKNNINTKYSDKYLDIFLINQSSLSKNPWLICPEEEKEILDKIKKVKNKKLIDLCDSKLGIKEASRTGNNMVYILNDKKIIKNKLEKELLFPKIKGAEEIKRWYLNWNGEYILLPYSIKNDKFTPVHLDNYPNTKNYLLKYKDKLLKRKLFTKTILEHDKNWYEIWNPLPFQRYKIIYPEISNKNSFAFDEDNFYFVGKNFIIYLDKNEKDEYLILMAILNSKILEFYFKHFASIKRGNYFEYMGNVGELPIIIDINNNIKQQILHIVNNILEKYEYKDFKSYFDTYINKIYNEPIEYYELSYEFEKLHKKMRPEIIIKNGTYTLYFNKDEKPINIKSENIGLYIKLYVKGITIKKNHKISILIPKNESLINKHIVQINNEWVKIQNINVFQLEEDINKIIYELYELNENDEKIINKFLNKFI